jgi:hypothetical protein
MNSGIARDMDQPKNSNDRCGIEESAEGRSAAPSSSEEVSAPSISKSEACGITVSRTAFRRNSLGSLELGIVGSKEAYSSIAH